MKLNVKLYTEILASAKMKVKMFLVSSPMDSLCYLLHVLEEALII
jgi:hypothetical protein